MGPAANTRSLVVIGAKWWTGVIPLLEQLEILARLNLGEEIGDDADRRSSIFVHLDLRTQLHQAVQNVVV